MTTSTPTRYISCTETAKLIRAELKKLHPGVKFSVRSSQYSGGASIHVSYSHPEIDQWTLTDALRPFNGATFDGMTDSKNYVANELDGEPVHFGADYVFVRNDDRRGR